MQKNGENEGNESDEWRRFEYGKELKMIRAMEIIIEPY